MAMRKAGRRSTENGMVRALRTRNRDGFAAPDKPADDDGGAGDTLEPSGESRLKGFVDDPKVAVEQLDVFQVYIGMPARR